jgi:hypothetical protein
MRIPVFVILSLGLLASRASAAIVDADNHPSTIQFGPGAEAATRGSIPTTQQEAAQSLQMTLETNHAQFQIQDQAHVASHVQVAQTASSRLAQILANLEARWTADPSRFDKNQPLMGKLIADIVHLQSGTAQPMSTTLASWIHRRDLDPSRFDHYHPTFGPLLAVDEQLRTFIATHPPSSGGTPPAGQIVLPPGGGTTDNGGNPPSTTPNPPPPPMPPPPPLAVSEPVVPEPSAWLLMAMGASLLGCGARFGRARCST